MKKNNCNTLLSIVIPFKNEEVVIKKSLSFIKFLEQNNIEIIFVNDGSSDFGPNLVKENFPNSKMIELSGLGTGKAFYYGMKEAQGEYTWLLPIDCTIAEKKVEELIEIIKLNQINVHIFPKRYSSQGEMKFYSYLQNFFLLKVLRLAAWTNGFILKSSLLQDLQISSENVFLNDLELSRILRIHKWNILKFPLIVSPRRYHHDGKYNRIVINGVIVLLWSLRLMNVQKLHDIYRWGKKSD